MKNQSNIVIGKLEDGSKDPCYDCKYCNTDKCLACQNYDNYEAKQTAGSWSLPGGSQQKLMPY